MLNRPQEGQPPSLCTTSSRRTAIRSISLSTMTAHFSSINNNIIPLFDRALVFQHGDDSCDNSEDDISLAAVLLFNTGLCHHIQALQQGDATHLLRKAFKMYSLASAMICTASTTTNRMMEDGEEQLQMTMRDENTLIVMALLNNMAQIHSCCMELSYAFECLETMEDIFDSSTGVNILSDDFVFFSMACTLLSEESFAACPAA